MKRQSPLAREALTNALTISIAIVSLVLMLRNVNPLWLVVNAGVTGPIAAATTINEARCGPHGIIHQTLRLLDTVSTLGYAGRFGWCGKRSRSHQPQGRRTMAGQRKRIVAVCYGPIAFGPQYRSPWEDVWIRWKAKPGRRLYYAAPTLICRAELLADLKRTRERHRKRPRHVDITHDEAMLAALEVSPHATDDCDPPNVYTRANGINRAEAERMLAFWLERRHGIKNPKFGWRKTDFCITPTGFGDYQSPDSAESGRL